MREIKNNPQVYTTQEGIEEIKNNPQVYTTQKGIEEIKSNSQVTTQKGIREIKNNRQLLRVIFFTEIRACHILEKKDDFNNVNKPPYTHNK